MISASDFLGSRITFDHFQGEPQSPNANHCPLLQCWGSSRAWLGVIQVCITSPNNYLLTTHILPYLARFFHSPKKKIWSTADWMHWLWHHSWNPPYWWCRNGGLPLFYYSTVQSHSWCVYEGYSSLYYFSNLQSPQ